MTRDPAVDNMRRRVISCWPSCTQLNRKCTDKVNKDVSFASFSVLSLLLSRTPLSMKSNNWLRKWFNFDNQALVSCHPVVDRIPSSVFNPQFRRIFINIKSYWSFTSDALSFLLSVSYYLLQLYYWNHLEYYWPEIGWTGISWFKTVITWSQRVSNARYRCTRYFYLYFSCTFVMMKSN